MDMTIGKRIAHLRKEKGLTQEELAQHMGISPQAVSKWENDQTCPDISALPKLARLFDVTVDELLEGRETLPAARVLPPEERKDVKDMLLRITVDSAEGDKIRVNLPMVLVEIAMEIGMEMPQINGNDALKGIDMKKVLEKMGMESAFSSAGADFSGLGIDSRGNIFIDRVIQKTHIDLDNSGTRAAAVTAVTIKAEGGMMDAKFYRVEFDRPFLYAIIDTQSGLPIFIGICDNIG